ncbi:heavy metal translocating P-type ATPase [Anaerotignum propionicum]|uniref:Cd(2+)-exporting ATPase n=1 Tax=Anaerotignum propionicum DSM 1682 TaxID=991789 RepID=A0A0X8VE23_ANAPI|nr:heavy metal translocating P-type ATPase [Anaerotignum propionicum]AMJ42221.1 cadmium, zinc and cobalt-transporting ATPase [Anaerotignum propionicum DSM 1682]SHE54133.1 Cd2+/Zn2+-exporting ATPase [[Clostridium] propionicum DSM 1682] [Anaerotignum propionicum DSM 1682]
MKVYLKGLTCANCAGKIETAVNALSETRQAEINLVKQTMEVSLSEGTEELGVLQKIEKIVHKFEPDVVVAMENSRAVETAGCSCSHCHEGSREHEDSHALEDDHGHDHGNGEEGEGKKLLIRFGLGGILFLAAFFMSETTWTVPLFLISYGIFGYDVLLRAIKNIARGQVFDENFLMSISTVGAIAIGEMPEAVFVMMFYQIGEAFQDYAVRRSRKSITALLDIRPDSAEVITESGVKRVHPEEVQIGDIILVKAGERIPLDGRVKEGHANLDTAALTGEALPRGVEPGSDVLSGCINLDGNLKVEVTRPFKDSTVMKILEMVENASGKKSKTERFITRFARVYTPVVVGLAVALAVLPPVLGFGEFQMWFGRALIFLVVSCPCALVLSVPLSYFAGIGASSKNGILVKGGGDLDTLCHVSQLVFDKTGTLTKGKFSVVEIEGQEKEELMYLAALGEANSNHPIAEAIVQEYKKTKEISADSAVDYKELGGFGVSYSLNGEQVLLGNHRLMEREKISFKPYQGVGSVVYVAKDGMYMGYIVVADTLKDNCKEALSSLRSMGVHTMTMLTGDRKENAQVMAKELGIDQFYAELLPEDKVRILDEIKGKETGGKVAFVGDGINDAPVLAGADLGVAMGGIGSDAAIEAADVVLMDDDIGKLSVGIRIAKNTRVIVRQNIAFALGIKALVLVLSAVGMATMWMAVFADVGVAVLAILNAMRKK